MNKEELYKILENNLDIISCREVISYIYELEKENKEYAKTIVAQDLILKAQDKNIKKLQHRLDKAIKYIGLNEEDLNLYDIYDVNGIKIFKILRGEDDVS